MQTETAGQSGITFVAFYPKHNVNFVQAGLLAYTLLPSLPDPAIQAVASKDWQRFSVFTVAGTAPELHRYSLLIQYPRKVPEPIRVQV